MTTVYDVPADHLIRKVAEESGSGRRSSRRYGLPLQRPGYTRRCLPKTPTGGLSGQQQC